MPNIILVDDEFWALKHLESMLAAYPDYRVLGSFVDSLQAWEAIRQQKPDVVFTDLRMNGMTGQEMVRAIHKAGLSTLVVIVSAYSDFSIAQEAIRKNVFDYLLKPIDPGEMNALIQRMDRCFPKEATIASTGETDFNECYCIALSQNQTEETLHTCISKLGVKNFQLERLTNSEYKLSLPVDTISENAFPSWLGMSRPCSDFASLACMRKEAAIALLCGFHYSVHPQCAEIQAYLALHYSKNITLDNLAEQYHFSKTYLCDLFRAACGTTIISFLKHIRLCVARQQLVESTADLSVIACKSGFHSLDYFVRLFKAEYGMSPREYRERQQRS